MSQNALHGNQEHSLLANSSLNNVPVDFNTSNIERTTINISRSGVPAWNLNNWNNVDGKDPFELSHQALLDQDAKKCAAWKEEVQNLLILAALFSAVVTSFVIESYQTLLPDPNDQIISLLSRIADQTSAPMANTSTNTTSLPTTPAFVPTPSSVRINIFWFISLVLSLTVALTGIITLQWLREYQNYENGTEPIKSFAIWNARSDGLKRWYVPQIFTALPLLLQVALVLFLYGLVEFLLSIRIEVAIPVSTAVAIPILFLVLTTTLPTLQLYTMHFPYSLRVNDRTPAPCPYKSPQALIFQRAAIISVASFKLFTYIFSTLWIPFVVIVRLLVTSDKPFYGESAPNGTVNYRDSVDRLRKAARHWMSMDIQWLGARTSYAVAFHTPNADQHLKWPYNAEYSVVSAYYDCVKGIIQTMRLTDHRDYQHAYILNTCANKMFNALGDIWEAPFNASSIDPARGMALRVHLMGLRRIIGPYSHPLTENLPDLAQTLGDVTCLRDGFIFALLDHAVGSEIDFETRGAHLKVSKHMISMNKYLSRNTHELFLCSNPPGITPLPSLSSQYSLLHHRHFIERTNYIWMEWASNFWTRSLRNIITDVVKMPPRMPFTHQCTGSATARCGSNFHTESIIELTEYILLFQTSGEIQETLHLLHDLIRFKSDPVQDIPFVLIIACAYINAVVNVDQDNLDAFRTLFPKICRLCGSLDPMLAARPGRIGRHWPKIDEALDYIRSKCVPGNNWTVPPVTQPWGLPYHHPEVHQWAVPQPPAEVFAPPTQEPYYHRSQEPYYHQSYKNAAVPRSTARVRPAPTQERPPQMYESALSQPIVRRFARPSQEPKSAQSRNEKLGH